MAIRRKHAVQAVPTLPIDTLRITDITNVRDKETGEEAGINLNDAIVALLQEKLVAQQEEIQTLKTQVHDLGNTMSVFIESLQKCTPADQINQLTEGYFAINENGVYVFKNGTLQKLTE